MAAIGSTQQILNPEAYLCECADKFILCNARQHVSYHRFKVGDDINIDKVLMVDKLRRIVCEGECGLCPDEMDKLKEKLNKILS